MKSVEFQWVPQILNDVSAPDFRTTLAGKAALAPIMKIYAQCQQLRDGQLVCTEFCASPSDSFMVSPWQHQAARQGCGE